MTTQLNEDQQAAVTGIIAWLNDSKAPGQALLSGEAGTGKTFCMKTIGKQFRGRIVYTAPTNKATKVLRTALTEDEFRPLTKTIYSLLGLRLQANGELKELVAPEEEIDLGHFAAVVVDEGSMVNNILLEHIQEAQRRYPALKFLFVGDSAQLPPVGERQSGIWELKTKWHLSEQMRNGGPILELARDLRKAQESWAPQFKPKSVTHENGIVNCLNPGDFEDWVRASARAGEFTQTNKAKVVCWRNNTVDSFNRMIRLELFDDPSIPWQVSDRIILTEPARDFIEDEPLCSTDDEGVIDRVDITPHPLFPAIRCHRMSVTTDDNRLVVLWVLYEGDRMTYSTVVEDLAAKARSNGRLWRDYWAFREAFHQVRHAYAITAHRAQGSTYEKTFVNWRDILINRDRVEAYKCLYVASTRPKFQLILG